MDPNHLKLLKRARTLELAGQAAEAATAYSEFLAREPRQPDIWSDYAGQLMRLNRFEEAAHACRAALGVDPRHLSAQINLGCILMQTGRLDESESRFHAVLKVEPRRFDARLCLAECLIKKEDIDGAQRALDGAYQLGPIPAAFAGLKGRHAEQWTAVGSARLEQRQFEAALGAFQKALQLDPRDFTAQANLGATRMAQGSLEEALGLFQRLVAEHPSEERARLLLITCLARKGDQDALQEEIAKAIQQKPNSFSTHRSVMGAYYFRGDWAAYRAEIERYRRFYPRSAYADFEEGCVDLLFGDMARGWSLYEGRLRFPEELRPQRTFPQPSWDGAAFTGKTLLLWCEQGFGDTLMALRYLSMVKALGGRVLLEVQPALARLSQSCQAADQVVPNGQPLPGFDLQASLMSLPCLFRTELSSIPAAVPYLEVPADPPHRQAIQQRLEQAQGSTRIGLVWAGYTGHPLDYERSLSPSALAPLSVLPEVAWFSLQVGGQELPPLPNLIPLAPWLGDFSDTAYALSHMDLLITVDTSVAHLAGALGIPTLLLLPFAPDFRWMLERDDSPWYPTLRLYRQAAYGDWEGVIQRVIADLLQEA